MTRCLDEFVNRGGRFARFGGNFIWQIRFDEKLEAQYCYRLPQSDPETKRNPTRATTMWDCPIIGRPGAHSVGLTGVMGCYTRYGMATPRSSGGFQVYRPSHWALQDSELRYGNSFRCGPIDVCAFEVNGADYKFVKGLPHPTGADGAPEGMGIIAMCPAVSGERGLFNDREPVGGPLREA